MRHKWTKRLAGVLALAAAIAALAWFAWPPPVEVDLALVSAGPMEVAVEEEAKTRVRHIYTVSAPVAGKVLRTPRHVGDPVIADETPVAVMQPTSPSFLDVRSREELQAAAAAAEAAVKLAEAEVRKIQAALDFARTDLQRAQALARTEMISAKALDRATLEVETNEAALASARAQLEVRRSERASATARLIEPMSSAPPSNPACCIQLRAPATGRVLKLIQESEAVVAAGAPLIEIGDLLDLEIVAELLSMDAVQVAVGAAVRIDGWGGSPIQGRVKRVDPAGFLKVSALGIEEQRVQTVIDLVDPPKAWAALGHDYRVVVHIVVWSAEDVLTVPLGALFRDADDWAVYAMRDRRARKVVVQVGRRNNRVAEVVSGLSVRDVVILHPSDRIREGSAVTSREDR